MRKIILSVALGIVLLLSPAGCKPVKEDHFKQGNRYYDEGKYEEASQDSFRTIHVVLLS